MSLPYIIYYIVENPEYGKSYTLDDIIEENEELYGHLWGDWMTLGRKVLPYAEWLPEWREATLKEKNDKCKHAWSLITMPISDDNDLHEKLLDMPPTARFHNPEIHKKFIELQKSKNIIIDSQPFDISSGTLLNV